MTPKRPLYAMDSVMADHNQLTHTQVMSGIFCTFIIMFSPSRRAGTHYAISSESARGHYLAARIALGLLWHHNPRPVGLRAAAVEA